MSSSKIPQRDTWSAECHDRNCQSCDGYDVDGEGLCECRHHETEADTEHYSALLRDQS